MGFWGTHDQEDGTHAIVCDHGAPIDLACRKCIREVPI